jgi:hypothetical protein
VCEASGQGSESGGELDSNAAPGRDSYSAWLRQWNRPRLSVSTAFYSGVLETNDPVYNLRLQFADNLRPLCLDALDDDDCGEIDLSDAVFSLAFQFFGGL